MNENKLQNIFQASWNYLPLLNIFYASGSNLRRKDFGHETESPAKLVTTLILCYVNSRVCKISQ